MQRIKTEKTPTFNVKKYQLENKDKVYLNFQAEKIDKCLGIDSSHSEEKH